jgi:hypothetical protein
MGKLAGSHVKKQNNLRELKTLLRATKDITIYK